MGRLATMTDLASFWIEVNRLENEADQVYRGLLSRLFSGSYEALTVLKLKQVADDLEEAADAFEHVATWSRRSRSRSPRPWMRPRWGCC